jgi:DNA-binding NtrC family response regulator
MYEIDNAKILTLMDESGLKQWRIANELGIHRRTLLRRMRTGDWTGRELALLGALLQCDPGSFFKLNLP